MFDNIDELIEINLKLLIESNDHSLYLMKFVNELGSGIDNFERFAKYMEGKGLINIEPTKRQRCDLTALGYKISQNGGWLQFLKDSQKNEDQEIVEKRLKEHLENELTKSNLEANELNKTIAIENKLNEKKNRLATWINILIGILNIGLLLWQILKKQ